MWIWLVRIQLPACTTPRRLQYGVRSDRTYGATANEPMPGDPWVWCSRGELWAVCAFHGMGLWVLYVQLSVLCTVVRMSKGTPFAILRGEFVAVSHIVLCNRLLII